MALKNRVVQLRTVHVLSLSLVAIRNGLLRTAALKALFPVWQRLSFSIRSHRRPSLEWSAHRIASISHPWHDYLKNYRSISDSNRNSITVTLLEPPTSTGPSEAIARLHRCKKSFPKSSLFAALPRSPFLPWRFTRHFFPPAGL